MAYEHQINEHERPLARALWERIFPEDTQAFLDAFFTLKGDNVILGVTEREAAGAAAADGGAAPDNAADRGCAADRLAAMIHLDPCSVVFGQRHGRPNTVRADYVVGVSTLPEYRHRGLMASLLKEAFERGAARKDPFIFLMPANEQVYLPFDFRTVYLQTNYLAADADALAAAGRIAGPEDCGELAGASSNVLAAERDIYLVRDERYFRELIEEMAAEDGKVVVLPGGYLCFWPNDDGGALVRELVLPEPQRTRFLTAHGLRPAPEQPKIMVRPLDPAEMVKPLRSDVPQTFTLEYHDDILELYDGLWTLTVGPEGGTLARQGAAETGSAPRPLFDMDPASLAEWVFGVRELPGTAGIRRPDRILINEWI
ncbi:MAG: GNAT family N-acetyltransferase [Lachnospiraceae bacterium]|nr:GNAT family N-acetyltransferase [Lachnospiraceae bacterium]